MTTVKGNITNSAMFADPRIAQGLKANNLLGAIHRPEDAPAANSGDSSVVLGDKAKLVLIKQTLTDSGVNTSGFDFENSTIDQFKNSDIYKNLEGTPVKQDVDNIINNISSTLPGGGGAVEPGTGQPVSPTMPAAQPPTSMYNEGNVTDPEKIQDALGKYIDKDDNYVPEGKDKQEKIANTEKDITAKKEAKEKLGKNYDEYVKQEGDNFVREYAAQKRERTIQDTNKEIFNIVQPEEAKKIFNKYNGEGSVADVKNVDYKAIDCKDIDKHIKKFKDLDFNAAYNAGIGKLDYAGDLIPEYAASINFGSDLQAKGEAKIHTLNEQLKSAKTEDVPKIKAQIAEVEAKVKTVIEKKAALQKALITKKDARQKELDEIFATQSDTSKNAEIKKVIAKRDEALKKINENDDDDIKVAKELIKSGDMEKLPVVEAQVIDATLLNKSKERMTALKTEKAEALADADKIIVVAQDKLAELKDNKPPAASNPAPSAPAQTKTGAWGDILGKVLALGGMAASLGLFAKQSNLSTQNMGMMFPSGTAVPNIGGMTVDWNLAQQISNTSVLPRNMFGGTGAASAMAPLGLTTNAGATAPIAVAQAKMNTGYNLFQRRN